MRFEALSSVMLYPATPAGSGGPGGTTLKAEVAEGFGVVSPGLHSGFIQQHSVLVQFLSVP